jgi:Single-strand binding protein family
LLSDWHQEKKAERFEHDGLMIRVGLEEDGISFLNVVQLVTDLKNIIIIDSSSNDLDEFIANCPWILPQIAYALAVDVKFLVFIVRNVSQKAADDNYVLLNCDWNNQEELSLDDIVLEPKNRLMAVPVSRGGLSFDFAEQLSRMGYPLSKYLGMDISLVQFDGRLIKGQVAGYDGYRYRLVGVSEAVNGEVVDKKQYYRGETKMMNRGSSRGVNKAIVMGHLGADPEIYPEKANPEKSVVRFSLATTEKWKIKGENDEYIDQERTDWHRVVVFHPLSNVASKYLNTGKRIYVEGSMVTSKYQDAAGIERYSTEIQAEDIQFAD